MTNVRYTYPDPYLSLWQSAAAEIQRRHDSVRQRMGGQTAEAVVKPIPDLMQAADRVGVPVLLKKPIDPDTTFKASVPAAAGLRAEIQAAPPAASSVVGDCAEIASKFLWAEITGNHAAAAQYAAELHYAVCDPRWAECVTLYLKFKAEGGQFPYRANMNVVLDLGAATKIAIIGDWGTGQDVAINLLKQVQLLHPDLLIHLGDIYFAGTQNETQRNFLDICNSVFGANFPMYSLCGNHDMYSGGNGYYWLVDQLKQQASYFCLQNANWQFLAMDTGHNDHDPFTEFTNMTSLDPGEAAWHQKMIQQAGGKKTVLLSHHQLFSPFGAVGAVNKANYAYNPNLLGVFQSQLKQISCWFWGHEHTLAIYNAYMGLQCGRCVGCSAVPVFTDQQSYTPGTGLATYNGLPLPTWNQTAITGNNGTDYYHGFAMMTLTGATATVNYYQVPILGAAAQVYTEQL